MVVKESGLYWKTMGGIGRSMHWMYALTALAAIPAPATAMTFS
jgi:hypothetical protein